MGKTEIPLQQDMFSREWVDNRTAKQKREDEERERQAWQLYQKELFSSHDLMQFGVNAHPLLPISSNTSLALTQEDPRTLDQIERDLRREAEERTHQMFEGNSNEEKQHD